MMKKIILSLLAAIPFGSSYSTTIIASSLGFNAVDATTTLQNALNFGADTVIIDLQASDWITQPLFLDSISNMVILLEPGVEVVAKAGAFPGSNDNLLRLTSCDNITILGNDAVFRMQKAEYTTGEWRHCLSIRNSHYIRVYGLELNDSGGDGLYIANTTGASTFSHHIHIKNCRMNNNKRQGVSIISADEVLIEHCEMTNTNGTSPEAGIDFEPDLPTQRITNIILRKCVLTGNHGSGILVNSKYLDGSSQPVSITIEDCYLAGNRDGQLYLNSDTVEASGEVIVSNTLIENSGSPGVFLSKSSADFLLTMNNCVLKNVADTSFSFFSPITFQTFASLQNTTEYGGAVFNNCLIEFSQNRAYLQCVDLGLPPGSSSISGNFTIVNPFSVPASYGSSPNAISVTQNFLTSYPLQTVAIQTSDADAFEGETDAAGFEINRASADSFPLSVTYAVSGPAINRTDYSLLTGFLIIPSLALSASDSLYALSDLVSETTEEVWLKADSSNSYSISGSDSVVLFIDPLPASAGGSIGDESLKVYPVPFTGSIRIHCSNQDIQRLILYDVNGKQVLNVKEKNTQTATLSSDQVAPGIYMLSVITSQGILHRKVLKIH